ncbi:MAG: hypothetical protein LBO65_08980 [Spirochaetaceae bacterium]|jgi:hypothetical protein|nr:hypothetical protein [Spirochaetaceae bacterium]
MKLALTLLLLFLFFPLFAQERADPVEPVPAKTLVEPEEPAKLNGPTGADNSVETDSSASSGGSREPAAGESGVPALWDLLRSAEDPAWGPDWPPELPPDLFYVPGAVSVSVEFEDGTTIEMLGADQRFRAFPMAVRVPGEIPGEAPPSGEVQAPGEARPLLLQGRCEFDRRGRLVKLLWGESNAEVLQWDGEDRPLLFRIFSGDYYFAVLEYLDERVVETWYGQEGNTLFVLINSPGEQKKLLPDPADPADQITRFYRDNRGHITGIEGEGLRVSAQYNDRGMPRYLERIVLPGPAGGSPPAEIYRYQWDEAGRLVRFSGGTGENPLDYRYEYTLDSRGNWTERRELVMQGLGPRDERRLTPARTGLIKRRIRYGNGRN